VHGHGEREPLAVTDAVRRAEPVLVPVDATASEAFAVIVAECTAQWRANVAGVVEGRDVESLHQTRVGIRRLRSAFSLYHALLRREPEVVAAAAELRARALPLGRARDLDVLLAGPAVGGLAEAQIAALGALRESAYDEVAGLLTGAAWTSLAERIDDLAAAGRWRYSPDPPARTLAGAALERRWARVIRRGAGLRDLPAARRHSVRIEAKKLRYGSQFFASLYAGSPGTDPLVLAEVVATLQDALGELNDVATARTLLAEVGAVAPEPDTGPLLEAAVVAWAEVAVLAPFWR